jgi:hypothetical protein
MCCLQMKQRYYLPSIYFFTVHNHKLVPITNECKCAVANNPFGLGEIFEAEMCAVV